MAEFTNDNLFHLLHQKSRSIKKRMDAGLKDFNLYSSQWSILFCLDKFGEMAQTEICKYLNVEAPTITRTLESMEKSGWVHRNPGADKRERIIVLTEEAKGNFSIVRDRVTEIENEWLLQFTEEEKQQLQFLLRKFEL